MSDLFGNYTHGPIRSVAPSSEGITLYNEDCRTAIKKLADNSIDSVVTDPPYALVSIVKRFGKEGSAPAKSDGATGIYARASAGFMGKQWDTGEVAFDPEFWTEVLRVLKPGGHVLAFGGTRSYHRLVCAIEDAGFEIRDQIGWLYGTGFPKSLDVSKAIDKAEGHWRGRAGEIIKRTVGQVAKGTEYVRAEKGDPITPQAQQWQGWGTALKPAWEPICLARKPLIGTVVENVLTYGTGAINIDGCRVPAEKLTGWGGAGAGGNTWNDDNCGLGKSGDARPVMGRHPANIIHDGSDEVIAAFPETRARGNVTAKTQVRDKNTAVPYASGTRFEYGNPGDAGSAARFFYSAKASKSDRDEGLDDLVSIEVSEWENEDRKVTLLAEMVASQLRVIFASGTTDVHAWNTMLSGNRPTALSLQDLTYITKTESKQTTVLKTLNFFRNLDTSGNTQAAYKLTENGASHAGSAEGSSQKLVITNEKMALVLGVDPAASRMPLKISVSEGRSTHPTVKPTDLMAYLCRLVTPPGGVVLDPFMGSGSTGKAALREGFRFVGIEREAEYFEIAKRRVRRS